MAGRWTTLYIDGEYKDVWIDLPTTLRTVGSASTASGPAPVLLDKRGQPMSPAPKRQIGFKR